MFFKIVNDDFNYTIKIDHFKLVGDYFITIIIGHFRIATNYLKVLN